MPSYLPNGTTSSRPRSAIAGNAHEIRARQRQNFITPNSNLAKNAGMRVDEIERFYARNLPSPARWRRTYSFGD